MQISHENNHELAHSLTQTNLCGNHYICTINAQLFQRISKHNFTVAVAVHVCSVEKVDPEIVGCFDDWQRGFFVEHPGCPLGAPKAHTSKAQFGYFEARSSKVCVLHVCECVIDYS